MKGWWRLWC